MENNQPDCEDFVQRFVAVQARLYGYIATLVPSRADADELFQQTSLVLWRKHGEFDPSRDFLRWACGIAHNLIRNFRKQHRRERVALSDALLDRLASLRDTARQRLDAQLEWLVRCLDELPPHQRETLELCYLGGQPIGEVAAQQQLSPGVLYKRLDRIRWGLVDCIRRHEREDEQS
jgi:RNA polymerase sigma-70 factor (ECF subfamily)